MTIRERIDAFWSGERPDRIPYTIYWNEWRHTAADPAWTDLYRQEAKRVKEAKRVRF